MKREWLAIGLLSLLVAGAALNIVRTDQLTSLVKTSLAHSENAARAGDFDTALLSFDNGLSVWQDARSYTSVFLRHPDVDAAADAFYELRQLLLQKESAALPAAYQRLRYHLDMIAYMEHPSAGTIF